MELLSMPYIDENRVKGNFGSSSIMKELCKFCLVRPVYEGTDQGIDLYCETFEIPFEGRRPFLHFWVQVKTTTKSGPLQDGTMSFNLRTDHLLYWKRQPVPVFVFLIHIPEWPLRESIYPFYIIDIKSAILESPELLEGDSHNLRSNLKINSENELRNFILDQIPYLTASHTVSEGIIPSIPTLDQEYSIKAVTESCHKYLVHLGLNKPNFRP
jgi:hypothetical protein